MDKKLTLVLGGVRSGKSAYAQGLAEKTGERVLFVATAQAGDDEMRRRIEAHQRARPSFWRTLETPTRIADAIIGQIGGADVVLLDCVSLLVSNLLEMAVGEGREIDSESLSLAEALVDGEIEALLALCRKGRAGFVLVSSEVGLGFLPTNPLGRAYGDLLGKANQKIASQADAVYLMVAGLPLEVKGLAGKEGQLD